MMLILVGCSNETEEQEVPKNNNSNVPKDEIEDEDKGNLTLQVSKADEEAGLSIDNHNIYNELNQIVEQNPKVGAANDFSLFIVDTMRDETDNAKLLFLGINRLPEAIKNVSFEYTLGNDDDEFVWENEEVTLTEEQTGVLQVDSAIPIALPLTDEQETLLKTIDEENQMVEISNFKYEKATE